MPAWTMLNELSSYSLSDLLLFSQDTYLRLFELYNAEVWPAHMAAGALGLGLLLLVRRPSERGRRLAAWMLALSWAWVGWAFHIERYATINPWAVYLGALFLLEALLLLLMGSIRGRSPTDGRGAVGIVGTVLLIFGLFIQPFLGLVAGRTWTELSLFGLGPDPTATATLGMLLVSRFRGRWILMVPPLLWCVVSTLTAIAMNSAEGFGTAGAGLAALGAVIFGSVRARSRKP